MRSSSARGLVCLVVAVILSVVHVLAADDTPSTALSLNERAYVASRVYSSLSYFAHWRDLPDMDVEGAYRVYLEKALASADRTEFSHASMEFLAGFHSGHTMFIDRELVIQGGSLPFTAAFLEGKWVVTQSWSAGLKPGDVLESIDGQPFEMMVWVGAKHEMFPDGSRFEGVGIKPDVEIRPTVEDIKQGRDAALGAARKHLGL